MGVNCRAPPLTCSAFPPSSSDTELDGGSREASSAEPCEDRAPRLEPPLLQKPLIRHSSLREALTRAVSPQCPEEPRALHGEQRACLSLSWACSIPGQGRERRAPSQSFLLEDQATGGLTLRLRGSGLGLLGIGIQVGVGTRPRPSLLLHEKLWNLKRGGGRGDWLALYGRGRQR